MQEILSEGFDRRDLYFLKRRPYIGKLHVKVGERVPSLPKLASLFTKSCEQNMQRRGILFTSYSTGLLLRAGAGRARAFF